MSRLFDDAQEEYLQVESPAITNYPIGMACWFKSDDDASFQVLMQVCDKDEPNYYVALMARGDVSGDPVAALSHDYGGGGGAVVAESSTGYTANVWHHAGAMFLSTTERHAYIDGGSKGSDTDATNAIANHDRTSIAAARDSTPGGYTSGNIAEAAIWDLTDWGANDAERETAFEAALVVMAAGGSPQLYPTGLVAFWPLVGDDDDYVGAFDLTPFNTPAFSTNPDRSSGAVEAGAGADTPAAVKTIYSAITEAGTAEDTLGSQAIFGSSIIEAVTALGVEVSQAIFNSALVEAATATDLQDRNLLIFAEIVEAGIAQDVQTLQILDIPHPLGQFLPLGLVIQPGWNPNTVGGSADNFNNPTPIAISPVGTGASEQVVPTPAAANKFTGAGQINSHELPWYEVAHLLPRLVQELGTIVSQQVIDCELYNADRNDKITVDSITNNLGTGITVGGVPATPFDIESQEGLIFTLTVESTGDLTIDASYTLHLSTGEDYTIYITGSRIVLFPIRPEAPLREHLIFDTKIIEAVDASEQRIANREYPRGMFEATFKGGQKKIEMILFDRQAKIVAFPAWHEPAYLDGAHSADDLTVTVNTTAYANFFVGGYAVVIQDENYYDALKIESMTSTTLTFESGLTYDYADKVQVMPLLTAYIEASSASIKNVYNQQNFNLRIHVDPEINDIADDSAWSVYDGKPFMDGPNMIEGGQLAEALRTKVFVIDNLTGLRTPVTAWDHNKRHSKKGWKTNSRQELWELRQLLHFLKGRQVSFYIPTFWKDIVVTDTMQIGTSVLNMDNIGYTINAYQRWPKQFIRIIFKDGSILVREIQNSAQVSETQEQLTLDDSWPATYEPDEIERIEYLEKVRIDVDDIVIIHYNALGQSECIVPIKEVSN